MGTKSTNIPGSPHMVLALEATFGFELLLHCHTASRFPMATKQRSCVISRHQ